jgi:hypothetical protein
MEDERRRLVLDLPLRLSHLRAKASPAEQTILDRLGALLDETDLAMLADQLVPADNEGRKLVQQKALDMPRFVLKETRRLHRLGLRDRLRIVDLGAGSGAFCWVAGQFGHIATALEQPQKPQSINLPAFIRFYGVPLVEQPILPGVPLALSSRFDLVTSFAVMFNHTNREAIRSYWTADDYRFFFEDLRANVLVPGGQVLLKFNMDLNGKLDPLYPQSMNEYYAALGRLLGPAIVRETADGVWINPSIPLHPTINLPALPAEESSVAMLTEVSKARQEWKRRMRKSARRAQRIPALRDV